MVASEDEIEVGRQKPGSRILGLLAKNLGSGKSGSLAIRRTAWSAQKISHPLFIDQPLVSSLALAS